MDAKEWITERNASGTVWKLFSGSNPVGVSIFKNRDGYILNQDEYPEFSTLKKAKDEGIKRYKKTRDTRRF